MSRRNDTAGTTGILHQTPNAVEQREIDAALIRLHHFPKDGEALSRLRELAARFDLDEQALAERTKTILARKLAEAKARQEATNPAFTDPGVVIAQEPASRFLVWGESPIATNLQVRCDVLLANPGRVDQHGVGHWRFHRGPGDTDEAFGLMIDLLKRLAAGQLRPGKVAVLARKADGHLPGALPTLHVDDEDHLGNAGHYQPVRHPMQTERQFDKLMAEFNVARAEWQRHRDRQHDHGSPPPLMIAR